MIHVYMVKTPSCSKCMMLEPQWKEIQSKQLAEHPNDVEFTTLVLTKDSKADELVKELNIRTAPTFVINYNDANEIVNLDDIENKINELLGEKNED